MTDLDPLRRHLAGVSDEELAKEHAQGRDAYRSSEAWELVQEEFTRRGQSVAEVAREVEATEAKHKPVDERRLRWPTRLAVIFVDGIILMVAAFGAGILTGTLGDDVTSALLFLFLVLYHPGSELIFRRTVGKVVAHAEVVMRDGSPPTVTAIAIRAITRPLVGGLIWIALFGHPWVHDVASRTAVVYSRDVLED